MNIAFFYIIAAAILIFSVLSVTSRKILRAATYLLFVLISSKLFSSSAINGLRWWYYGIDNLFNFTYQ